MQFWKILPTTTILLAMMPGMGGCVIVRDGESGEDGTNGESCTLLPGADDDSFILRCGEEETVISNGADGVNGESCTIVEDAVNGSHTIVCGNNSATIRDGESAEAIPCTIEENQDGSSDIVCGDSRVTVRDGEDGENSEPCTVADNMDGSYTITCDGESVTMHDGEPGHPGPIGPIGNTGEGCTVTETAGGDFQITCGTTSVTIRSITIRGMRWQDPPFPNIMKWQNAQSACAGLGAGWRLPNLEELLNLLNCSPEALFAIYYEPQNCSNCQCASCQDSSVCSYVFGADNTWESKQDATFWSSTPMPNVPVTEARAIDFSSGNVLNLTTTQNHSVRCIYKAL